MANFCREFKSYVDDNLQDGSDLEGRPARYICADSIMDYWIEPKINRILQGSLPEIAPRVTRRILKDRSIMVLSVLAYASTSSRQLYVDEIVTFLNAGIDDNQLPLTSKPPALEQGVWTAFHTHQWTFCPLRLGFSEYHRTQDRLDTQCIFPGIEVSPESLGKARQQRPGNAEPRFKYMKLGKDPRRRGNVNQVNEYAVIKSYPPRARSSYDNETLFLSRSEQSRRVSENVVTCLGFYSCWTNGGNWGNIILEYASKGSLFEYYAANRTPRTNSEIRDFWKSMFSFLRGLENIHHRDSGSDSVHHDIHPGNLLIFPVGHNNFDFKVKLCDFELSCIRGETQRSVPYIEGISTYSAPERVMADQVEYVAHPACDVYAAGAVIVEAAAWIKGGEVGRREFKRLRAAEIAEEAPGLSPNDLFHDGTHPLTCVQDSPRNVRPTDSITSEILCIVLQNVLDETQGSRIWAGPLMQNLERVLVRDRQRGSTTSTGRSRTPNTENRNRRSLRQSSDDRYCLSPQSLTTDNGDLAERVGTSQGQLSPTSPVHTSSSATRAPTRPRLHSHSRSLPELSYEEVVEWREKGRSITLTGQDVAMKELKDRDIILVVDNSDTMQEHKKLLLARLSPLAYILKRADPDALEIMLTNDCELKEFKSATDIERYAERGFCKGREAPAHLEKCFETLLERIRKRLPSGRVGGGLPSTIDNFLRRNKRRVSIYFFTDGAWVENSEGGDQELDCMLSQLADDLDELGLDRRWVSLQFIRFGDNLRGKQRLNDLDNFFPDRDFIDHKPENYPVWHILVGALHKDIDDSPDPSEVADLLGDPEHRCEDGAHP